MQFLLQFYLDACRWWAFGGAFLAAPPLCITLRKIMSNYNSDSIYPDLSTHRTIVEKVGIMACVIGTMIGGAFLPLSTRFPEMVVGSYTYAVVMSIAWTFWSLAVWIIAFAFAKSRPFMVMSAFVWGAAVWMATIATGGA